METHFLPLNSLFLTPKGHRTQQHRPWQRGWATCGWDCVTGGHFLITHPKFTFWCYWIVSVETVIRPQITGNQCRNSGKSKGPTSKHWAGYEVSQAAVILDVPAELRSQTLTWWVKLTDDDFGVSRTADNTYDKIMWMFTKVSDGSAFSSQRLANVHLRHNSETVWERNVCFKKEEEGTAVKCRQH